MTAAREIIGAGDRPVIVYCQSGARSARAAAGVVLMQCGIAWLVAFVVHCVGGIFGLV